jgi:hypothetical protein
LEGVDKAVELGATGQGDYKSAGRRNDVELVIGYNL